MPQRWVVERSFAWLEKCRRFWKNTERLLNTQITIRQSGILGTVAAEILNRFLEVLSSTFNLWILKIALNSGV
jgi:transposase